MPFNYTVLGAGRQGVAIAYDLAKNCDAARVMLVDSDETAAASAVTRLERLAPGSARFVSTRCDVEDVSAVTSALGGAHVCISAVPYRFNAALSEASIAAGCSFCDLGGNTAVVRRQLGMHEAARRAGVSVVPDCGLAPGLGNHLAAHGIAAMDAPEHVHVRCGGLPQQRVGPLNYKLLFNFQGLINEYSGFGEFVRDGKLTEIPALTELEPIEFPAPLGLAEAAVTSGGTSTCPHSFLGRVKTYDYKTVRYPGHFAIIKAMFDLGCFEERVALRDGSVVEPKILVRRLMEERLAFPAVRDLVVLRVTVSGRHAGSARTIQYDLFDKHDEATGFTAMERTTGFPTAVVAHLQARRMIAPGAQPLETAVPQAAFVAELPGHDIHIRMS